MGQKAWLFEQIPHQGSLYIYGTGTFGKYALEGFQKRGYRIGGFIDSFKSGTLLGLPILTLEQFSSVRPEDAVIAVASMYVADIAEALQKAGISDFYDLSPLYFAPHQRHRDWDWSQEKHQAPTLAFRGERSPLLDLYDRIGGARGVEKYVVNIGCNDGKSWDPCYPLFDAGFPGLAVDYMDTPSLYENLPSHEIIKLTNTFLKPQNIGKILQHAKVPKTPFVLKIDIDSTDGPLLKEILRLGYQPAVIQIEINNDIPPPFQFALMYHPMFETEFASAGVFGLYGCSLSFVTETARPYGYDLFSVGSSESMRDAVLVRRDLRPHLPEWPLLVERDAFLSRPKGFSHMETDFGINTESWRTREDYALLLTEIWNACVLASQARFGFVAPFTLTY